MGTELPGQAEDGPHASSPGRRREDVTLLFTDEAGCTALKQRLGDRAGVELIEQLGCFGIGHKR